MLVPENSNLPYGQLQVLPYRRKERHLRGAPLHIDRYFTMANVREIG